MANRATDVELEGFLTAPAGLVPPVVAAALSVLGRHWTSPHAEERARVDGASSRRQVEFFGGRACARAALRARGFLEVPIGVGAGREPLWPPGVVGSIAHGGRWCGAVVAGVDETGGLGLDIEPLRPLALDVEGVVLTSEEIERLPTSHELAGCASTIAFSAKECLYKCLFPITRWAFEFHDVIVELDVHSLRYRARLSDRFLGQRPRLETLVGEFRVLDDHVFTALCLPAARRTGV